ncbi:hypothetical protein HMPREF0381_1348 [Lachnoanaerobaculum saburreum DSM 3986]|uniref:Uncharacterized protein n=1 Tax=Lachnoanaerobaculum saburreum DSM 3986 TaxID=887325 RepID=E6LN13_9FIRM|nr:hypothetical protein HMPREF0381_1348 [Lachnoanaerobaculum saburreum DSM 3986]
MEVRFHRTRIFSNFLPIIREDHFLEKLFVSKIRASFEDIIDEFS